MAFCILTNKEAHIEILKRCKEDYLYMAKLISPQTFFEESPESPKFHKEMMNVTLNKGYWEWDETIKRGVYVNKPRKNQKISIQAPRGFAKSTVIACFKIIHHILFYEGDMTYTVILSKSSREAKKRLKKIKSVVSSKRFRQIFGLVWNKQTCPVWREDKVELPFKNKRGETGGHIIESVGFGMQARGLKEEDTRVTLFIGDDMQDENNVKTQEALEDGLDRFLTLLPGLDKRNSQIIIIGTPLKALDIISTFFGKAGWMSQRYSACDEEDGTCLWEEHESFEDLMEEKQEHIELHKLYKWYSEKQCELVGKDARFFVKDDFRYWDGYVETKGNESFLHITVLNNYILEEEIVKPVNIFVGVDPASSTSKTADFSVTMPIAYDNEMNIYVLPYYEKRVKPTEHAEQIFGTIMQYKPTKVHVETVSYQEMLRASLELRMKEIGLYQRGLGTKFQPRNNKDDRLEDLERFTKSHKLHLKKDMGTLEGEMLLFPNGRKNLLDGLWYATRNLETPYHTIAEEVIEYKDEKKPKITWLGR